jgi:hypothetical protein
LKPINQKKKEFIMKSLCKMLRVLGICFLAGITWVALGNERGEPKTKTEIKTIVTKPEGEPSETEVAIEATADDAGSEVSRKDWPFLGIATMEASDALGAQLGLRNGAGLVVTYVAPDSPAAKADLQKHDVLTRLGEQWLVHPAQLRKLIHAHKQAEVVELSFYRAGKEQTASVTLGSMPAKSQMLGDLPVIEERRETFEKRPDEANIDRVIHESLRHLNNDRKGLHNEVHRSIEEVREAIKEAFRDVTNVASTIDPVQRIIRELRQSGVQVDKKATVTVRSAGKGVKSIVKADESGTIVLVQNPKIHLTAHDKQGRLMFDGEVETREQQSKVSPELWQRVEPLVNKMGEGLEESPKSE